jgi:hypothetical protein
VKYYVENGSLVREKDGQKQIVGNRITAVSFDLLPDGAVSISLTSSVGPSDHQAVVSNSTQITPKNTQKL